MWDDFARVAAEFPTAVLTGLDQAGYPFSTRVEIQLDRRRVCVRITMPTSSLIQPGPASLLLHSFNDQLWDLHSYMVRGTLIQNQNGWVLTPEQYTPGMSNRPSAVVGFVRNARRKADAYLKKRGLKRPTIPWDDIRRIKKEAGL